MTKPAELQLMRDFRHRLEVEQIRRARKMTDAEARRRKLARRVRTASKRKNR